jgi:membrane protein DedA with SNARE-associated domain
MPAWLDPLLQRMLQMPEALFLLILALAAAFENIFPPIPADVVILFGGFLVGKGASRFWIAFSVVWIANVAGALVVYWAGRRYGIGFFSGRWGRHVLNPPQLASLSAFYARFGFGVIFVSRFLPVFRSLVPAFAGVSQLGFFRTAAPIALASGIWYGAILYFGALAGNNWTEIAAALERAGRWLWLVVAAIAAAVILWWKRSRRAPPRQSTRR